MKLGKICLTGGIACGKSVAGAILTKHGFHIVDADHVCHDLLASNADIRKKILAEFGDGILGVNGEFDRGALGRIVFNDSRKLKKLNDIMHPAARAKIQEIMEKNARESGNFPLALVPLVYEAGWDTDWDAIICVAPPRSMQISRLAERGLTEKEALNRIAAQMPIEEKMKKADFVVFNSGSKQLLEEQLMKILG